jgi:mannose/fructose-specific phosphotransferase system component IIA
MSKAEGSEANEPRAIVIGHGGFSAGLVSAVDQICGMAGKLVGL